MSDSKDLLTDKEIQTIEHVFSKDPGPEHYNVYNTVLINEIRRLLRHIRALQKNLRTHDEVHLAHDTIIPILLGAIPNTFEDEGPAEKYLAAVADVLCWVLKHDHNPTFQDNLDKIERFFKANGIVLTPGDGTMADYLKEQ
jgi:hypothetical protein